MNSFATPLFDPNWRDMYVYRKIFENIPLVELFNIRCCSKHCRNLVDEYLRLDLNTIHSKCFNKQQFNVLANKCQNIEIAILDSSYLTDELLITFFQNNKKIKVLHCCGLDSTCTENGLRPLLYNGTSLIWLNLFLVWLTDGFMDCLMQHKKTIDMLEIFMKSAAISEECVLKLCMFYKVNASFKDDYVFIHPASDYPPKNKDLTRLKSTISRLI